MLEFFQYEFMQKAFLVAVLISIITPCIGVVIVLRRMSTIGETLSHNALAGIALGLVLGINPIVGAITLSFLAAFSIEFIRKAIPKYADMATSVILSAGIGMTAIFSGFVKNTANLNSFFFGSIAAITDFELIMTVVLSLLVILASVLLYKELLYITFDEEAAKLSGVPVNRINFIFMLLTAITISVASKTVGALIVSSLVVIPVACAMMIAKSYKQTIFFSIAFAMFFTIAGLFISFYAKGMDLKPGGTIVLLGVITLMAQIICKTVLNKGKR